VSVTVFCSSQRIKRMPSYGVSCAAANAGHAPPLRAIRRGTLVSNALEIEVAGDAVDADKSEPTIRVVGDDGAALPTVGSAATTRRKSRAASWRHSVSVIGRPTAMMSPRCWLISDTVEERRHGRQLSCKLALSGVEILFARADTGLAVRSCAIRSESCCSMSEMFSAVSRLTSCCSKLTIVGCRLVQRFQNINMLRSVLSFCARSGRRRLGIWIGGIHGGTASSDCAGQ